MIDKSQTARAALGAQAPFELVLCGPAGRQTPLAVMRRGKGAPVICLHAIAHGSRDFEQFTALSPGIEVIAVDWPGHGASPPDAENIPPSPQRYAELIEDLIPRLNLSEKPIVLGNSVGGATAIVLAHKRPDLIRALTLCDTGGFVKLDGAVHFIISRFVRFFTAGEAGAKWFGGAYRAYYSMVLSGKPAREQRARIVAAGYESAPLLRQGWECFGTSANDLRQEASELRVPALIAWCKQDRVIPWSRSKKAAQSIPDVEIALFPGGHSAFMEAPEAFAERFRAFREKISRRPPGP